MLHSKDLAGGQGQDRSFLKFMVHTQTVDGPLGQLTGHLKLSIDQAVVIWLLHKEALLGGLGHSRQTLLAQAAKAQS